MKPQVIIYGNVTDPTSVEMSSLVFKSIRVGFPTSIIHLFQCFQLPDRVLEAAKAAGCEIHHKSQTFTHDHFIHTVMESNPSDCVFCDTDMIFYESVEDWTFDAPLAGAFEPMHRSPVTQAIHLPRLHTSLLWTKASQIKTALQSWRESLPQTPFKPKFDPWHQQWLPINHSMHFADTSAMVYNAIGGQHFTEQQLNAFAHLQCGTWSKYVEPHIPGLRDSHRMAIEHPELFRGNWKTHKEWYERHKP